MSWHEEPTAYVTASRPLAGLDFAATADGRVRHTRDGVDLWCLDLESAERMLDALTTACWRAGKVRRVVASDPDVGG